MASTNSVDTYSALISSLSASTTKSTSKTDLTTDGFFKLLAAQLQNQDMSNPMSNAEMMDQMTQIAMMQSMQNFSTAMDDFAKVNNINYGTSMMGKDALVAVINKDGSLKKITGTITRVDIFDGNPTVYLDDDSDNGYPVANIMSVYEKGHIPPDDLGKDTEDTDTTDVDEVDTDNTDTNETDNSIDGGNSSDKESED
jgi:flagellar basal-body rod modification protein FlgD